MKRLRQSKKISADGNAGSSFEKSFSSEALLQQAIAALLTRMPDVSGVQILQGSQELGKDIIFYIRGGFKESVLCACVVKNSKITGVAAGKSGARTILIQAEQSFDSVYTDSFGKDVRVERVYVVTPYDLPPATVSSIKGRLQERAGQVVFIGGSALFDLFKQYWPDYFADEAEILQRHLQETKTIYEVESPLQGLTTQYNLGDVSRYPKKIYVSQNLYRDINDYQLGASLSAPLPAVRDMEKKLGRKEIQIVQDKLNSLRRAITFLREWRFCGEDETESIYASSNAVVGALMNTLTKQEQEELNRQSIIQNERWLKSLFDDRDEELTSKKQELNSKYRKLLEREEERKELHPEEARKIDRARKRIEAEWEEKARAVDSKIRDKYRDKERRFRRQITLLTERVERLSEEKGAEIALATEWMATLDRQKEAALAPLREDLTNLHGVLFSKKVAGIDALYEPSYLRACVLDDCVRAAPEGMFNSKKGIRLYFPRDILYKFGGHLLIVGAPGYGKTSFCRWHALQDAEDFSLGKSNVIPVYVPLYRFSRKPLGSFKETFLKNIGKSALLGDAGGKSDIRVRLYLDGLDEIASVERRREVVKLAEDGAGAGGKYQIILTSRDYVYARWLDWFRRITLGGFEEDDINELVDRWLGRQPESKRRFLTQVEGLTALYQLMRTPLLATLIILVFRQTGRLPENKTRLYENFISLLSGGWDLAKGVLRKSGYGERIKIQVLSTLAASLQERQRREFYSQDIKAAVNATLSGKMLKECDALQEEFIVDGLISKSGSVLQFAHHSFQEFLTAKNYMGSPQPTKANRALESYLCGDDWWKEVIKFYIGLSTSPNEINEWLAGQIRRIRTMSYISLSDSQVQDLRSAMSESFPEYCGDPF